ncbi:MAG: FAD/NAD(P)-binding protein [Thiogranum sp.]|nr:FAD/NAD(P)-binding protein [Thiogranum sp.]
MTFERRIPMQAEVVNRVEESPTIFTLSLRLVDEQQHNNYRFAPGQFNMLYQYGVGEIPISIVGDPSEPYLLQHTIRTVGRVTRGFAKLKVGDRIGLRGPFGRGWPLDAVQGRDVLIVTGGLGCAPVVPVINHVLHRRGQVGRIAILQGVKHSEDFIWRERYEQWDAEPDTQILLAADVSGPNWKGFTGRVTALFDKLDIDFANSITMMCGPELMMISAARLLLERGVSPAMIWFSMERNMQCAVGHCGHCQYAEKFICRDGPVFPYHEIRHLLGVRGF